MTSTTPDHHVRSLGIAGAHLLNNGWTKIGMTDDGYLVRSPIGIYALHTGGSYKSCNQSWARRQAEKLAVES